MEIDRNGLEVLTRDQCFDLLMTATVGRVGLTTGALPTILPVNFRLIDGCIMIRSGEGAKMNAALHGAVVAFEVDDFDPVDHSGWSVVVTGVARAISRDEPRAGNPVPIARWAPLGDGRLVSITTDLIDGRRLNHYRT